MPSKKGVYYKVWVKIEVEKCDYNKDKFENMVESEPIDIASYCTKAEALEHYDAMVAISEVQSAAALRVRLA